MKRLISMLAALTATTVMTAGDYNYLTLQTADGTETSVAVKELVLTIADGQLTATNSEGSKTFTLADLSKMYFSADGQTAIERVEAEQIDAEAEVFDLQGRRVDNMTRKGIYIVRQNGKTCKVMVK